jgi:8-amino-7-oxononanoate synthase
LTTALSPHHAATIETAIHRVIAADHERAQLQKLIAHFNHRMPRAYATTPIIPLIVGSSDAALSLQQHLKTKGIYVPAVRPPTVAPNQARLRITLCAQHTPAHIDQLLDSLNGHFQI